MPLVSLTVISLSFSVSLAPCALAKQVAGPVEQVQPIVTLSQLQPIHPPVIAPAPLAVSKTNLAAQKKRPAAQAKLQRKAAPADHYRQAMAFKAKGNTNRALVEFLKTTQKNPRQINAFYEQALIFRQQGYLKLADSALEQALRIAKSVSKNPKIKPLNENDLTRIRLFLATIRLEQGNVGSAAEELSRSLGITLSVKQPAAEPTNEPQEEAVAPTTILQSLHPVVEESKEKSRARTQPLTEKQTAAPAAEMASAAQGETQSTEASATSATSQKETAADTTVAELIKEGLAGLKEHIFNPLSILGVPRISMEPENSTAPKKKEKKTRRSFWREPKRKTRQADSTKVEIAKVDESSAGEKSEAKPDTKKEQKNSKKKRPRWWERRLALSPSDEVKAEDTSVSEQETESKKPVTVAIAIPETKKHDE